MESSFSSLQFVCLDANLHAANLLCLLSVVTQRDGAAGEEQVFFFSFCEETVAGVWASDERPTRAPCALMRKKDTSEEICNI